MICCFFQLNWRWIYWNYFLGKIFFFLIYFTIMSHKKGKPETWITKMLEFLTALEGNTEFFQYLAIFHLKFWIRYIRIFVFYCYCFIEVWLQCKNMLIFNMYNLIYLGVSIHPWNHHHHQHGHRHCIIFQTFFLYLDCFYYVCACMCVWQEENIKFYPLSSIDSYRYY